MGHFSLHESTIFWLVAKLFPGRDDLIDLVDLCLFRKQSLAPGQEHDLKVSAIQINSDDGIKGVEPIKRNCFFPGEKKLDMFKVT